MKRGYGILMHVASLPNAYGIGDFSDCYAFVDFLSAAGAKYWQVLPLNPTGFGNSPYQSPAAGMLNPYFISLDELRAEGLLTAEELRSAEDGGRYIDYGKLYVTRVPLLKKAYSRFKKNPAFLSYVKGGEAKDYALFMALKGAHGGASFDCWEEKYKYADPAALEAFAAENGEELLFWQFLQYTAARQWKKVKAYAASRSIAVIGDLPIYVAYDSVDVWKNPRLFKLDGNLKPVKVAGVPPDYFSAEGQLWGNPVFDYAVHAEDNFAWWSGRLSRALKIFDYVRIDHFRGLDRFYEIPAGSANAVGGAWADVPHDALFAALAEKADLSRVIAEDLGVLDDGVYELLKKTGFAGMSVLSFAFNGDENNPYLPEKIVKHNVCYTGTHDNDTLMGMLSAMSGEEKANFNARLRRSLCKMHLRRFTTGDEKTAAAVTEAGFACKANVFVLPMQDAALLGTEYRMNEPSTDKPQNWSVRIEKNRMRPVLSAWLSALAGRHRR
ncbi:MAG: 4-alpha-glucanotransferase [Bacillota bacterium]|nr:MAG: 4-alpha-glucanotransferase [Bacillota bacterium]